MFVGPVRIQPTVFGRLTGVLMSALVALLVVLHAIGQPLYERLGPLTEIALGVPTNSPGLRMSPRFKR